jgi:aspartyl-tRNA(Asn)/glutamyl-tRNA(Gln) amidotransferase subunit B
MANGLTAQGMDDGRWEPVIGLEIHAQLLITTKIFCGCSTAFGAPPNTHVCPVCLGLPGALPVLNRRAVEFAVRAAAALNCTIHETSVFARKNYFYPDLPKGYQISQYDKPLATGGWIEIPVRADSRAGALAPAGPKASAPAGPRASAPAGSAHRIRITRIHLEEDAGKSLHHGFPDSDRATYLDFNRSGVPLIEIVTEPDLRSAADAAACFARLRETLVALGINDGNMEEGSLRCDANVSVRPPGDAAFGTKAEVKNVNSFRYLQKALEFEIARQIDLLTRGGRVRQETRLWNSDTGETLSMRSKEEAHDYRYFPEPDLPPLHVSAVWVDEIRAALPELTDARTARFQSAYGLSGYDADALVRLMPGAADYFEAVVAAGASAKGASNWIQGEVRRLMKERDIDRVGDVPIAPASLAELIDAAERGVVSSSAAKEVLERMWATGGSARALIVDMGLAQVGDEAMLAGLIDEVIASNPDAVAQVRAGRANTFGFLVGQVMKASQGRANPKVVSDLLRRRIDEQS